MPLPSILLKCAPASEANISYTLGSFETRTFTFDSHGHTLKSVTVDRAAALSLYSDDCDYDAVTGVLVLNASYLETLPANDYVTFTLTFDDPASTVITFTIAVSGNN